MSVVSPLGTPSPVGPIPKVKRFVLAGTFDSGMYDYDSGLLYMGLADAQKFFGLGNAITGVEIRVNDLYAAEQVGPPPASSASAPRFAPATGWR